MRAVAFLTSRAEVRGENPQDKAVRRITAIPIFASKELIGRSDLMGDRDGDGKVGSEFLDELFSALEDLETQSAGVVQFLKDKGLATEEQLAPYLEAAAGASEVRWRAARLRMDALLAAAIKDAEEEFARKIEERNTDKQSRAAAQEPKGKPSQPESAEAEDGKREGTETKETTNGRNAAPRKNPPIADRENTEVRQQRPSKEEDGRPQTSAGEENPENKAA
jgi:hypothetical protein